MTVALAITLLVVIVGVLVAGFASVFHSWWQESRHNRRCASAQRAWEADCPRPREAFAKGGYHEWLGTDEAAEWLLKKPLPWEEEYQR